MLTVAILDNQAVARNLLRSVLQNGGHEVVADGNTSATTLARIARLRPQIICVDLGELTTEAIALLDRVRTNLPKSLIFLVSANIDAETLKLTQAHGVSGYIVKPFNTDIVLSAIRKTVTRIIQTQQSQQ